MLYDTGRIRDAVNCFFRNLFGSVSLQEVSLPVSSLFSLFLFSPFLSLSAHRRIFYFETKICQDNLFGNQDVKSDTTSAKNYDTCAH